jgi:DNA-binding MarR family transcriptional regulator
MSKPADPPYDATGEVRDRCLCLHAQRTARALARRFDRAFQPLGLTNGQFSLLMALNRVEPPGLGAVAAVLAMDRTTLTAALKPLQRRGLLVVTEDAEDRRGRRIALTHEGRARLSAALTIWRAEHGALDALLAEAPAEDPATGLRRLSALLVSGEGREGAPGKLGPGGLPW